MELINCPFCDSKEFENLLQSRALYTNNSSDKQLFTLVKCKRCELIYLNPRPTNKELEKYYFQEYYGKEKNVPNTIAHNLSGNLRAHQLYKWAKKKGKLLDIGCGDGSFLEIMKKNDWEAYGVEPSEEGFNISKKKIGGNIIKGFLSNKSFEENYFDLITLWHVFEHITNPQPLLENISRILKKDGTLILALPNIDCLDFKLTGKKSITIDLPRHVIHYSPKTIANILSKNGFKVNKIDNFSLEYSPFFLFQSILNTLGCEFNFLYKLIRGIKTEQKNLLKRLYDYTIIILLIPTLGLACIPISYLSSLFKKSNSMIVFAKKE